jgi:phosphoesterase RecJ-like protein
MVCSHIEPDGDSIGSQLAMASLLEDMNKEAVIVNQDAVPCRYRFLDPHGAVGDKLPEGFSPDTAVVLDCSHLSRLGKVEDLIHPQIMVITIDHHHAVPQPGDPAYLDPKASSTAELLVNLIHELQMPMGPLRAGQLYAALFSDPGGFRFPNTTAKSLSVAAELALEGADPHVVAAQILEQRTESSLRLLSRALGKLEMYEDGRVVLVSLADEDFQQCGACAEDAEGIVDFLVTMRECSVGLLLRQAPEHIIKVNIRTRGKIKANRIAETMGGGGHPNADGYRARGNVGQARERALQEIRRWL